MNIACIACLQYLDQWPLIESLGFFELILNYCNVIESVSENIPILKFHKQKKNSNMHRSYVANKREYIKHFWAGYQQICYQIMIFAWRYR